MQRPGLRILRPRALDDTATRKISDAVRRRPGIRVLDAIQHDHMTSRVQVFLHQRP